MTSILKRSAFAAVLLASVAATGGAAFAQQDQGVVAPQERSAEAPPPPSGCAQVDEAAVQGFFGRYVDALRSRNIETVMELFADNAVVISPTVGQPQTTTDAIRQHFTRFLQFGPDARVDNRVVRLGCNSAIDSGTLTYFLQGPGGGGGGRVQARYTVVYEYTDQDWYISAFHASYLQPDPQGFQQSGPGLGQPERFQGQRRF